MLSWASRFDIFCFLDGHDYQLPYEGFECLLAAGSVHSIEAKAGQALDGLRDFARRHRDWLFGHFAYGLARETEPSGSHLLPDPIGFPDLHFFLPEIVIRLYKDHVSIGSLSTSPQQILEELKKEAGGRKKSEKEPLEWSARFSREEYLDTIRALQKHILLGDCYEINFCQEFFAHPACIDPQAVWEALSEASPNPFAAHYRLRERYLFCASPERYLRRIGDRLISQPIKGTLKRVPAGEAGEGFQAERESLYRSSKDRAENVMVVDLVRNDLSKICLPGTVRVEELYGIYSFPQVHQMISTVTGELPAGKELTDIIRATFPMGSMTGAPKPRVVELIHQYERTARGLFSGALGYITPKGDFDFNVIIRSLFYNKASSYLSYQVGSGITFYSDPEAEYEECLLKAEGIRRALEGL